jgi:DNA-binding IclR family transcriptional regulator
MVDKTLFKGLQLLELLAISSKPRGVKDLSVETGFTPSNVHRLLKTLEQMNYVSQAGPRGTYQATPRLFALGRAIVDRIEIGTLSLPFLQRLHELSGGSASLSIWYENGPLLIKSVESRNRHPMRTSWAVGSKLSTLCTSAGLTLLAYQPAAVIAEFAEDITPATPRSISTAEELHQRLDAIRRDGICIAEGEWQFGLSALSVPVVRHGDTVAVLTISGATDDLPKKKISALIKPLRAAATDLSNVLQGHFSI